MRCVDEFGDSYPDDEDEWYPKKDEMFQFYFYPKWWHKLMISRKEFELEIKKIIYWDERKQKKEWNKNNISYQVPVNEKISRKRVRCFIKGCNPLIIKCQFCHAMVVAFNYACIFQQTIGIF